MHATTEKINLDYEAKGRKHEERNIKISKTKVSEILEENTGAPEKFEATREPTTTERDEKLSTSEVLEVQKVENSERKAAPKVHANSAEKENSETMSERWPEIMSDRAEFMPNGKAPPNPNFIFHNKVPKSGSSTMKHIFKPMFKKFQ